jgi:Rrf2 family protein
MSGLISQKAKYALRALVALARAGRGESRMIGEISRDQAIPKKFLEQILLELKRAGIVTSRRGRMGGYELVTDRLRLCPASQRLPIANARTARTKVRAKSATSLSG